MRRLLVSLLGLSFAVSMGGASGCSSSKDDESVDTSFEQDWLEDYESDTDEDQAEADELAQLDTIDDLDDVEVLFDDDTTTDGASSLAPASLGPSLHVKKTAPKHPPHGPLSIIEDDPNFSGVGYDGSGHKIYDAAKASERMGQAQALGADVERIMLWWHNTAPDPDALTKPAGFVASRPDGYDWSALDMEITQALSHGMKVMITVTAGPMPWWASEDPQHCKDAAAKGAWSCAYKPKVKEFAQWVTAVGRHVKEKKFRIWGWTLVNEPNIPSFLDDDSTLKIGQRYRALWMQGRKHLRKTAHVNGRVFFGDMANQHVYKATAERWAVFEDALCMRLSLEPEIISGYCPEKHRRVQASGVSFHPYSADSAMAQDSVQFLQQLVENGESVGELPKNRGLYMTESGFLTARGRGSNALGADSVVTDAEQAKYMNETDRLLSDMPRVKTISQYELVDEGRGSFDCGLRYARIGMNLVDGSSLVGESRNVQLGTQILIVPDGSTTVRAVPWAQIAGDDAHKQFWAVDQAGEKPAYAAYRLSIDVQPDGSMMKIFGLARPDTGAGYTLEGLFPSGAWQEIQVVKTDELGYGRVTIDPKGATAFRIRFGSDVSRVAK